MLLTGLSGMTCVEVKKLWHTSAVRELLRSNPMVGSYMYGFIWQDMSIAMVCVQRPKKPASLYAHEIQQKINY